MRRRIHDMILKAATAIALVLFAISVCCIDSGEPAVYAVCIVSFGWLALFAYVNGWFAN